MYPVSARFLDAITGSHRAVVKATAVINRQFAAVPTGGLDLPVLSGDVRLAALADVNGTLDLSVPGDYWAEVQPYGVEIHVARGVDFGDGTSELVPLGYYRVDDVEQDSAPYGPLRISGSDRSAQLQQNRVLSPYQVPAGTSHRAIFERLVNGRPGPTGAASQAGFGLGMFGAVPVPIVWAAYDPDRAVVGSGLVVQDSTYDFLAKLADGQECVLRFDEIGQLRVEARNPDPDAMAQYTIEIGRTGTLIRASRKVTRDGVYNIVSAYGSDPAFPTGYSQAYNADPASPLYWKGPFGAAPRFYASPVLKTADAAAEAAATILGRSTGLPASHSLLAVPNPAVRPLDVLAARVGPQVQRFVLDTASIPLAGGSPVEIGTRTANPVGVIVSAPDVAPPGPAPDPTGPDPGVGEYANPAALHQIRVAKGGNHFNLGVGYPSGHVDITPAALEGGFTEPGFYYLNATKTAVVMSAPLNGKTTSANTKYPRVEYREYDENGAKASWNPSAGTHYCAVQQRVTSMAPNKPELVVLQSHDSSDDTSMIRFRSQSTVEAKLGDTVVGNLTTSYTLGTWYIAKIQIKDGTIGWYWNDMATPVFTRAFPGSAGQYFKSGCYIQSNLTYDSLPAKFEIEMSDLEAWHTGYAKPVKITPTGSGGGTTPPVPPPTTADGTQAAVTLGWGAVIDGDEFEYTGSPSGSKWGMYDGEGHGGNGLRRPSAFSVANGVLTCYGDAGGTTGGMAFKRDEKYARIEVRARTYSLNPGGRGNRYHPVLILWPTSDRWPQDGESDFFETDCDSGELGWFIHIPGNDGSAQEGGTKDLDIQNWHNYAVEWDSKGTRGYVDGVKYFDYGIRPPGPMHLTIQLDNFYGSGMEPGKLECAWVRVYQRPS
jgi:Alginate lyase/Domain of unknown function (DUF5047)/Glycosyl hydrolases family 16